MSVDRVFSPWPARPPETSSKNLNDVRTGEAPDLSIVLCIGKR